MSARETFAFVYSGATSVGIGLFSLTGEQLQGRDFGGGTYEGSVREIEDGRLHMAIQMHVPAGVDLSFGASAQDVPHQRTIEHTFPALFGEGKPQTVMIGPGTVYLMIRRVPDDYHAGVEHGFTIELANKLSAGIA